MVFNEYMTWAMFSLYCYDNYPHAEVDNFVKKMENRMVNDRYFVKFKEFNQELISQYNKNHRISMSDLYDIILLWAEKQQVL
jgi:hypothetical protein